MTSTTDPQIYAYRMELTMFSRGLENIAHNLGEVTQREEWATGNAEISNRLGALLDQMVEIVEKELTELQATKPA